MRELNAFEIQKMKNELQFYDFYNLDIVKGAKYTITLSLESPATTFSDLEFKGERKEFAEQFRILMCFIQDLLILIDEESCVIMKYNENWFENKMQSTDGRWLFDNLLESEVEGITVSKEEKIVKLLIQSVLYYNSFILIVFVKSRIIIAPTDHMDIFIFIENSIKYESKIDGLIDFHQLLKSKESR
ncbi:MAG: hypothetical protein ACRC6X_07805 [Culicoidibacterales bacterium]